MWFCKKKEVKKEKILKQYPYTLNKISGIIFLKDGRILQSIYEETIIINKLDSNLRNLISDLYNIKQSYNNFNVNKNLKIINNNKTLVIESIDIKEIEYTVEKIKDDYYSYYEYEEV